MSLSLHSSRARLGGVALFSLLPLVLAACGADRPTPAYPASDDPAIEDTDLAQYVSGDQEEEEDYGPEDDTPFEAMPADDGQDGDSADAGAAAPAPAPAAVPAAAPAAAPATAPAAAPAPAGHAPAAHAPRTGG